MKKGENMTKRFEDDLNELRDSALDFGASFLNVLGSGLDELFNVCENVVEKLNDKFECNGKCDEECENYEPEEDDSEASLILPPNPVWDKNDDLDSDVIPVGFSFDDELVSWNPEEDGNLLTIGQPGSGKTMLSLNFVEHAINHQWNVFSFDPKRDISSYYRSNEIITVSEVTEMLRAAVEIQKMINHNIMMTKTHKGIQLKKTLVVISEPWVFEIQAEDSPSVTTKKKLIVELLASIMKYGQQVGVYVVVSSNSASGNIASFNDLAETAVIFRVSPEEQLAIDKAGFESDYDMESFSSGQGVMIRNHNECQPVAVFYNPVAR